MTCPQCGKVIWRGYDKLTMRDMDCCYDCCCLNEQRARERTIRECEGATIRANRANKQSSPVATHGVNLRPSHDTTSRPEQAHD